MVELHFMCQIKGRAHRWLTCEKTSATQRSVAPLLTSLRPLFLSSQLFLMHHEPHSPFVPAASMRAASTFFSMTKIHLFVQFIRRSYFWRLRRRYFYIFSIIIFLNFFYILWTLQRFPRKFTERQKTVRCKVFALHYSTELSAVSPSVLKLCVIRDKKNIYTTWNGVAFITSLCWHTDRGVASTNLDRCHQGVKTFGFDVFGA